MTAPRNELFRLVATAAPASDPEAVLSSTSKLLTAIRRQHPRAELALLDIAPNGTHIRFSVTVGSATEAQEIVALTGSLGGSGAIEKPVADPWDKLFPKPTYRIARVLQTLLDLHDGDQEITVEEVQSRTELGRSTAAHIMKKIRDAGVLKTYAQVVPERGGNYYGVYEFASPEQVRRTREKLTGILARIRARAATHASGRDESHGRP